MLAARVRREAVLQRPRRRVAGLVGLEALALQPSREEVTRRVPGVVEEMEVEKVEEEVEMEEVEEEVVEVAGEEEPEAWRVVSHSRSSASGTRCGRWM